MSPDRMTALVTGASSGLGQEFAKQLAAQGYNLVLVARSEDKMNQIAASLPTTVTVIPADLSDPAATQRIADEVRARGIHVDLLINNAGLGVFENFCDTPAARQMEQIDVNVRALTALSHAFAPAMSAKRRGGIINIASTAAYQPLPGAAVYAASKSFVLFLSEALSVELEPHNVHVLAASPGPVATRFFANKNPKLTPGEMDQPAAIVAEILSAFQQRKRTIVPGKFSNRVSAWFTPLVPRNMVLRVAAGVVRNLNQKAA